MSGILKAQLVLASLLALGVSSCAATDPLSRTGLWRPNGSNEQNLRLMVANQNDLLKGRGETDSDGADATAAIQRLRTGKLKDFVIQSTQSGAGGAQ